MNLSLCKPAALAALFVTAAAVQAQAPKVEMALFADANDNLVQRLDLQTGRYFGAIGAGKLQLPRHLAVDNKKATVYVVDGVAIKKFDVSTGRYLGAIRPTTVYLGQPNDIVVEPNGTVDVIIDVQTTFSRIQRFDPTTGAMLAQSASFYHDVDTLQTLTVDASGTLEAWISDGYHGQVDRFSPGLAVLGGTTLKHVPIHAVRTHPGGFLYCDLMQGVFHTDVYGGTGAGGTETKLTGIDLFNESAAEGANGVVYETYPADNKNVGNFEIDAYDTSFGAPFLLGSLHINIPADFSLVDMAVYVRY